MKKLSLFLLCICASISSIYAQNIHIKGTVKTVDNGVEGPAEFATILIKETGGGTTTDLDGNFELMAPTNSTIVFSYTGFETKELKAQAVMNVKLVSDTKILDEVVVTGIGGTQDKRTFTGATDQLSAAQTKIDGIADIARGLEGRSAGVSVQSLSSAFGTAPKINVRGRSSIHGTSNPLWVLDGVVVEPITEVSPEDLSSGDAVTLISSAIAGLNSEDIESFQILKDGSATSIYGARAMAGVIVITTKKGRTGVSSINYTGEFTYRMKPSYNEFNIMNSQDQMGIYKEMEEKGWLNFGTTFRAQNSGIYGKMYQLINDYDPIKHGNTYGGYGLWNTQESKNSYLRDAEMRNTDWFDELFKSSIMQNHSVSISSGNDRSSYYASISAMFDPGWMEQSKVERYTGNFNATFNILPSLSLNMISMGSYRKQRAPGTLGQDTDVVNGEVKRDFDINPYSYALNTSRALDPNEFYTSNYAPFNIKNELDNNYIDINVVDLKFQGELTWKLPYNIKVSGLAALNYKSSTQEHHTKDDSNMALAYRAMGDATTRDANSFLYTDPDNAYSLPITVLPEGGIYMKTDYKMQSLDFRGTVSWVEEFNKLHMVNFFGGAEGNTIERNSTAFEGWGLQYNMGETPFFPYEYFKKLKEEGNTYYLKSSSNSRMAAFFASATYSYDGKYSFNATGRYEGTNQMGKSRNARWLPTWNLGLAWNVNEEKFFKEHLSKAFSHLMFKTSYSLTGSPVPQSVSNSTVIIRPTTPYRPFADIQESALQISWLENSDLTYEKKHEFNIGVEMGFLSNRLSLGVDYFTRNNFDLIGAIYTQGVGGENMKYANVADMKSSGVEFSVNTINIKTKDKKFEWNTSFIFGYNTTEVTEMQSISQVISLVSGSGFAKEGYPVRSLFSIRYKGLDENGVPTFLREDGTISSSTDPSINFQSREVDHLKYEGSIDPKVTGSLGNIFTYKGFRLNVFITYSFGNVVRINPTFSAQYSDLTSMTREYKNRWMLPGDEQYTDIPVILNKRQYTNNRELAQTYNAYNFSDVRVAKGDFIRMKEISLTYNFKKLPEQIQALSLKVQGANLFLIYADKKLNGQDPEFIQAGGVSSPNPRQFTLTLRASF